MDTHKVINSLWEMFKKLNYFMYLWNYLSEIRYYIILEHSFYIIVFYLSSVMLRTVKC